MKFKLFLFLFMVIALGVVGFFRYQHHWPRKESPLQPTVSSPKPRQPQPAGEEFLCQVHLKKIVLWTGSLWMQKAAALQDGSLLRLRLVYDGLDTQPIWYEDFGLGFPANVWQEKEIVLPLPKPVSIKIDLKQIKEQLTWQLLFYARGDFTKTPKLMAELPCGNSSNWVAHLEGGVVREEGLMTLEVAVERKP